MKNQGFTPIELIIVLAILGVFLTILIPAVSPYLALMFH